MQDMVSRKEYLSVLAELEALQTERAGDRAQMAELESEMQRAWEHLEKSAAEMEDMRAAQSSMVPLSELEAAVAQYKALVFQLREAEFDSIHSSAVEEEQKTVSKFWVEKVLVCIQVAWRT